MYERFTDRARRVMVVANQDAQTSCREYIGTEHILIGLTRVESSACVALLDAKATEAAIRAELAKIATPPPAGDPVVLGRLPHTPRAKNVIGHAIEEAKALGNNYVGTEHLLLGLLREREGVACAILAALGVNLDTLRAEFVKELKAGPAAPAAEANPEFIVAEVSKNWAGGRVPSDGKDHIAKQFEHVIGVNLGRGYVLYSWQLHRMTVPSSDPRVHIPVLNETIVAVFRRPAKAFFGRAAVVVEEDGGRDAAAKAG